MDIMKIVNDGAKARDLQIEVQLRAIQDVTGWTDREMKRRLCIQLEPSTATVQICRRRAFHGNPAHSPIGVASTITVGVGKPV